MWYIDVYENGQLLVSGKATSRNSAIQCQMIYRAYYGPDVLISVSYEN